MARVQFHFVSNTWHSSAPEISKSTFEGPRPQRPLTSLVISEHKV